MILCEGDAPEGHPGWCCVHLYARILSSSITSVSIFSVCCYSIVSISMYGPHTTVWALDSPHLHLHKTTYWPLRGGFYWSTRCTVVHHIVWDASNPRISIVINMFFMYLWPAYCTYKIPSHFPNVPYLFLFILWCKYNDFAWVCARLQALKPSTH